MKPGSLSFRLALWVGALGLAQALGVLYFSYRTLENELDTQSRTFLQDKADQARYLMANMQDVDAIRDNAFRLVALVAGRADLHLAIASPGAPKPFVAFSAQATESYQRLQADTWERDAFLGWRAADRHPMLSFAGAAATAKGAPLEIVVSADRTQDQHLLHEFLVKALTAAPFALSIVFAGAVVLISFGLKPLQRFTATAAAISPRFLSERLSDAGLPTELQPLQTAFNHMLERLDDGMARLSQYSSDLAHEMRTPLATLLGRTQVALLKSRTVDELVDVLEDNIEELQRLSRLVSDMLFIAQADSAIGALKSTELDLRLEVIKVASYLDLLAEERGVEIVVEGSGTVVANAGLVERALSNVLSNAIRYCKPDTRVAIVVEMLPTDVLVAIINQGEPIPEKQVGRFFERFYREDSARSRDGGGSGLGLAIVQTIMRLHDGSVEAQSAANGEIRFTLRFPRRPSPAG